MARTQSSIYAAIGIRVPETLASFGLEGLSIHNSKVIIFFILNTIKQTVEVWSVFYLIMNNTYLHFEKLWAMSFK